MTAWAIVAAIAGLFAFGAVMYRAGRKSAENKAFKAKDKENEQVDKIIRANSTLSRDECLKRLRDDKDQ